MLRKLLTRGREDSEAGKAKQNGSPLMYLHRVDIFRDLPVTELEEIARGMPMRRCVVGTVFYTPEDTSERLFILKTGSVELYRLNADGKRIVLGRLGPCTLFGEMGLLGQTMHGAFAETVEESLVCTATQDEIAQLLKRRPEVMLRLLEMVGSRLRALEGRLAGLALSPVRVRLADFLLAHVDPATNEVTGFTHAELGDTIGALRQTVTETLNAMQAEGLVHIGHKRIRVLERDSLRRLVEKAG